MSHYKVAFVGPRNIHGYLSNFDEKWDLQIPLERLEDLEREFALDESEAGISKDTNVIILFSRLFSTNPNLFSKLVAFSCPYSVVCILTPKQDLDKYIPDMHRSIKQEQEREALSDDSYNMNTPYFIVDYENAHSEIYSAIESFVKSQVIDSEIRETIKAMLPYEIDQKNDYFEDFSDYSEDVVLPKKETGATGQVFTVTSSKGGSGKSTVSILLGATIALASKDAALKGLVPKPLKVCLVDLDTRDGQHWILMDAKRPSTVIDILGNGGPTEINIQNAVWHSDKTECDYLFAPKRPRTAKEIPPMFYAELIQKLRTMYDVIILDTSVNYLDPLGEKVAYPLSDKVLFVSDMGKTSLVGCARWIKEVMYAEENADNNIPSDKVGIIINKAMNDVAMSIQKIEKATSGLPIVSMIPSDPKLILYAANVSELQQVLKIPIFKNAFMEIAEALLPTTPLGEIKLR